MATEDDDDVREYFRHPVRYEVHKTLMLLYEIHQMIRALLDRELERDAEREARRRRSRLTSGRVSDEEG